MNKKPLLKKRGFLYLISSFIEFKIINIISNTNTNIYLIYGKFLLKIKKNSI